MSNKRIIWLTVVLILCLVAGGLYRGLFAESFPFKIDCAEDAVTQLRFFVNRERIISKLLEFAKQKGRGRDISQWNKVEVHYSSRGWLCYVYLKEDADLSNLCVEINERDEAIQTVTLKWIDDLGKRLDRDIERAKAIKLNEEKEEYEALHGIGFDSVEWMQNAEKSLR
jgi:hypothetical protein